MTETTINATSPLQNPEPMRGIIYWGWMAIRRLLQTLLHLLLLVFLVVFAGRLALGGGIQSFPNSIPDAVELSIEFLRSLSAGELSSVEELPSLLPRSMGLLLISLSLGTVIGLILGGIAAIKRESRLSTLLMSGSVFVISTPSYVAGMFLIWSVVWFSASNRSFIRVFCQP